jgi:hypothetical protein
MTNRTIVLSGTTNPGRDVQLQVEGSIWRDNMSSVEGNTYYVALGIDWGVISDEHCPELANFITENYSILSNVKGIKVDFEPHTNLRMKAVSFTMPSPDFVRVKTDSKDYENVESFGVF